MQAKGTLFIVSAPSGGGKTTLVGSLQKAAPSLTISVSHTTRAPRQGESEGKNYFFVDEAQFNLYRQQGAFLEYAKVFNHWYGTSKAWVVEQLDAGTDVILDIDWQGARRIKAQMPCVTIFVLPPSKEALFVRLQQRHDPPPVIRDRMALASQEISHYAEYDFIVVNDDFETALKEITTIVQAMRLKTDYQRRKLAGLLSSLAKNE